MLLLSLAIGTLSMELVRNSVVVVVGKGMHQLLSENRIDDLSLIYQLFSRVKDGLKELVLAFCTYIKVSRSVCSALFLSISMTLSIQHFYRAS